MKIIILGASGLVGSGIRKVLERDKKKKIICTFFSNKLFKKLAIKYSYIFNVLKDNSIFEFISNERPDLIINCLGITKHLSKLYSEEEQIEVNGNFPKKLSILSSKINSRFIQISTDCVFIGKKGLYSEIDKPDDQDIYGKSKIIGEEVQNDHLVLRTSTIGREISTFYGLLEWFLKQKSRCNGYRKAYFSGITNVELGKIIQEYIIPNNFYKGIYNVGSERINKYDLLNKFSIHYKKNINIKVDDKFKIDRSLNVGKFINKFQYRVKSWEIMLKELHD